MTIENPQSVRNGRPCMRSTSRIVITGDLGSTGGSRYAGRARRERQNAGTNHRERRFLGQSLPPQTTPVAVMKMYSANPICFWALLASRPE